MPPTTDAVIRAAVAAAAAAAAGPLLRIVLSRRGRAALADDLGLLRWPVRALAAALFLRLSLPSLENALEWTRRPLDIATVAAAAWVALRALRVAQSMVFRRLQIDVIDNLRARSRRTQVEILRRIASVTVIVGAGLVAVVATTSLGPTILAYAGLIGVILGLALRTPLENLVAGVQVAVTEPIRIDDAVVVRGEWGHIEQIGLTNVVVRIWDDRRLVLPTSYFVSEPFENWTRRSAAVTGTVLLWVDFETSIPALRREFERVVRASPLWDGRSLGLQVVDLGERAVQVRATATAASAARAWDLRCAIREALLGFLTTDGGVPRLRLGERVDSDGTTVTLV